MLADALRQRHVDGVAAAHTSKARFVIGSLPDAADHDAVARGSAGQSGVGARLEEVSAGVEACQSLATGIVVGRRTQRRSLADAAPPSRLAHASLPGLDGVASLRLLDRRRDDAGIAIFQATDSRSVCKRVIPD